MAKYIKSIPVISKNRLEKRDALKYNSDVLIRPKKGTKQKY